MGLRPFFSFFGSKWALAKHYPAPIYTHVVEPFAGGAGYSLRHHGRSVTLLDTNPIIAGLWRYLIGVSASEILRLPVDIYTIDDVHECQEAKWLVGFWFGRACNGPRRTLSAWGRAGKWPTSFWGPTIRERIARQVEQIRHWRVIEASYENVPVVCATWFVDPPYERQGKHYVGPQPDYAALGEWCRRLSGQVIVCENDGARWLPFKPFAVGRANSSRGIGRVTRESIWTSQST